MFNLGEEIEYIDVGYKSNKSEEKVHKFYLNGVGLNKHRIYEDYFPYDNIFHIKFTRIINEPFDYKNYIFTRMFNINLRVYEIMLKAIIKDKQYTNFRIYEAKCFTDKKNLIKGEYVSYIFQFKETEEDVHTRIKFEEDMNKVMMLSYLGEDKKMKKYDVYGNNQCRIIEWYYETEKKFYINYFKERFDYINYIKFKMSELYLLYPITKIMFMCDYNYNNYNSKLFKVYIKHKGTYIFKFTYINSVNHTSINNQE